MFASHSFSKKNRTTIAYGICFALLLFLLKWLEVKLTIFSHYFELYVGIIALLFTSLGIWLALKLSKPKVITHVVEKAIYVTEQKEFEPNQKLIQQMELSKREIEIIKLMAEGLSNDEIAARIFVSLSTVKTHNQNIFVKLDVKRRTQAIEKSKRLKLIP